MHKTLIRIFTIADYEDEEIWLRKQHMSGWKLIKITPPCLYTFESCEPQDVIYRLDHKNRKQSSEYIQMAKDFGWEYLDQCFGGWLYFRKENSTDKADKNKELFSDNTSKIEFANHIIKTRLIPVGILFLISMILSIPISSLTDFSGGIEYKGLGLFGTILLGIGVLVNTWLTTYCTIKLKKIKDKYKK